MAAGNLLPLPAPLAKPDFLATGRFAHAGPSGFTASPYPLFYMCASPYTLLAEPVVTTLIPVSLAAIDAALLARLLLQPHPQLLFDCGAQPCRRNLGVCYFLSQLLMLRQRGASVWLSNVDPQLRRYIQQLGLESAFFLVE